MENGDYVLGVDLGANSLGWAVIHAPDGKPQKVVQVGVRVFDAGVEGDIESGKDASRAVKRRQARTHRRMLERRARRLRKVANLLQHAGLLPDADIHSNEARQKFFADLDRSLFPRHVPDKARVPAHVMPYVLRARALDQKLEPHELGRALYHLAHRRGFKSGRKETAKDKDKEKEEGAVKEGIKDLQRRMDEAKARTLGEYFSKLDPEEQRIRARWTSRQMYETEFDTIWAKQAEYYPDILTADFRKKLRRAIFFQRPLKWKRSTIGDCDLEKGRKRAPLALLIAQRFRVLQKVNDLEFTDTATGEVRKLTPDERALLADELEAHASMKFSKIRRLFKLPKTCQFNFERGGEEELIGNRTAARLTKIFGDRWAAFSPEERDQIVNDILSIQKDEALARRGMAKWGLDSAAAAAFGNTALEAGHCNLSRQALQRLVPDMEQGIPFATARKDHYGDPPPPRLMDSLPPLDDEQMPDVRNPAVERALTELRKVVNAIVRKHGKPAAVRIELARDMKKNRKDRKEIHKRNQENRRDREKAIAGLLAKAGIDQPPGRDIEKWLLAEECGWQCPYTGNPINPHALFGPEPQFDVEHIIPIGRCMDNSFMNKTLCHHEENRNVKRKRTPWEAYGSSPEKWEEILSRVRAFRGSAAHIKLQRFQVKDIESIEDYTSRQLNDTRYASRLAVRHLGLLYGSNEAGVAADGTRRVQAGRGQVTKYLRDEWRLNEILGDGGEKSRDDHRHHAVDAVCIALTDFATVKMLSDAAARAIPGKRFDRREIHPPWPGFLDQAREAVERIVVSHRVSRKLAGPLHEETVYSKPQKDEDGRECVHVRKRLDENFKSVADIVDAAVRERVQQHLDANGKDPKKAFADPNNHPFLEAKDGRRIPIHSVRIRVRQTMVSVGSGARERRVASGSNHHVEIIEVMDKKGRPKWEGCVVSTYDAMRRLRNKQPIIQRDHGEGKRFVCSLAGGEIIQLDMSERWAAGLYVIRSISETKSGSLDTEIVRINDARKMKDIRDAKDRIRPSLQGLKASNCRKVVVTPVGEVRWAND